LKNGEAKKPRDGWKTGEWMATYIDKLAEAAQKHKSILCFGIDPVIEKIPQSIKGSTRQRIFKFYSSIIDSAPKEFGIAALKPNYAFFAQYGWDGLQALQDLIYRYYGIYPIILDAKRGDIGTTSQAYARECFDFWGADAATVSPFMGTDSVEPFIQRCKEGRGVYFLCRTSNRGAGDFLELSCGKSKKPLYIQVLEKALKWHEKGVGLVVGATAPKEMEQVLKIILKSKKEVPLLIPGIGAQGGSAEEVGRILRKYQKDRMGMHRVNASSSIAYAYINSNSTDYIKAALEEIERINKALGY
jgi:orotidine-5'-phosphate decarboxylase